MLLSTARPARPNRERPGHAVMGRSVPSVTSCEIRRLNKHEPSSGVCLCGEIINECDAGDEAEAEQNATKYLK